MLLVRGAKIRKVGRRNKRGGWLSRGAGKRQCRSGLPEGRRRSGSFRGAAGSGAGGFGGRRWCGGDGACGLGEAEERVTGGCGAVCPRAGRGGALASEERQRNCGFAATGRLAGGNGCGEGPSSGGGKGSWGGSLRVAAGCCGGGKARRRGPTRGAATKRRAAPTEKKRRTVGGAVFFV